MEIHCSSHPDLKAVFLCPECGFLCANDAKQPNQQNHHVIPISKSINDYCRVLSDARKARMQLSFFTQLKTKINELIDQYISQIDNMEKSYTLDAAKYLPIIHSTNNNLLAHQLNNYLRLNTHFEKEDVSKIIRKLIQTISNFKYNESTYSGQVHAIGQHKYGEEQLKISNSHYNNTYKKFHESPIDDINSELIINSFYKKYIKNDTLGNQAIRKLY